MKIVQLISENIQCIKAVQITPSGDLVCVGGDNGAGKTSVLDSIAMAIGGLSEAPGVPVRRGTAKATIQVDLGEIIVKRTFTAAGTTSLTVTGKDGAPKKSPQAILDTLTAKLTFDPLNFIGLEAKKQRETLASIVGLNFDKLDTERAAVFAARTLKNSEVKSFESRLAGQPPVVNAPAAEVSTAELLAELTKRQAHNAAKAKLASAVNEANNNVEQRHAEYGRLHRQIEALKVELEGTLIAEDQWKQQLAIRRKAFEEHVALDETELSAKIAGASEANRKVAAAKARAETEAHLAKVRKDAAEMTNQIEAIDAQKLAAIAAAKFPVPGVAFDESGVLLNGLPFAQASSAQKMRVSVAISAALNPKLRVALVRDGSLMDEKSMALLAELAKEHQMQVWVERVGKGAECSVVISDGEVSEVRTSCGLGLPVEVHKKPGDKATTPAYDAALAAMASPLLVPETEGELFG